MRRPVLDIRGFGLFPAGFGSRDNSRPNEYRCCRAQSAETPSRDRARSSKAEPPKRHPVSGSRSGPAVLVPSHPFFLGRNPVGREHFAILSRTRERLRPGRNVTATADRSCDPPPIRGSTVASLSERDTTESSVSFASGAAISRNARAGVLSVGDEAEASSDPDDATRPAANQTPWGATETFGDSAFAIAITLLTLNCTCRRHRGKEARGATRHRDRVSVSRASISSGGASPCDGQFSSTSTRSRQRFGRGRI